MRKTAFLLAALTAFAAPAQAAIVLSDNFNSENGGASMLNYSSFANFSVLGNNVDLVKSGDYSITCDGVCVDLDGTPGPGGLISNALAFNAGDVLTISFDLGGSQRILDGIDNFTFAFLTSSGDYFDETFDVLSTDPFSNHSYTFNPTGAGTFAFAFQTDSADKIGPLLDNVIVTRDFAVPEPATWAMMIGGFALAGVALRRRKTAVSFA